MNQKQLTQNIKEIKEYLDADAFYHAKMSLNHLIKELEIPIELENPDDKDAKIRAELIANRPNLSPPQSRSSKPNNGCIR